jgi:hypothetical protein
VKGRNHLPDQDTDGINTGDFWEMQGGGTNVLPFFFNELKRGFSKLFWWCRARRNEKPAFYRRQNRGIVDFATLPCVISHVTPVG